MIEIFGFILYVLVLGTAGVVYYFLKWLFIKNKNGKFIDFINETSQIRFDLTVTIILSLYVLIRVFIAMYIS